MGKTGIIAALAGTIVAPTEGVDVPSGLTELCGAGDTAGDDDITGAGDGDGVPPDFGADVASGV